MGRADPILPVETEDATPAHWFLKATFSLLRKEQPPQE